VPTLYGQQEKLRVGYNPPKRDVASCHPLVCFEGQTRNFWHGGLSDVHTASGTAWRLRACFVKTPPMVHGIRLRADAALFDYRVVRAIEARGGKFVIGARLTPPLKRLVSGLRYTGDRPGSAVTDCPYQPHGWPHPVAL
jgi:hypothetical protein